jgi:hypothetical protein
MILGAIYGDAGGERELGWGLSFDARVPPARAAIGYGRLWGNYRSSVYLNNGAGKHWEADAGEELKPLPLMKRPNR